MELLIPQDISRKGLYSAQVVLANSVLAFFYKYYVSSALIFMLYITTLIHWNKIYKKSLVKTLDIILAVSSIISVTFRDSRRFTPKYATLWYTTITISIIAFILNECLLYYRLSIPQMREKRYIYDTSVNIHILFLHILLNTTCMLCVIGSSVTYITKTT